MGIATIDLIPASYREECRARRLLKWSLPLFALLIGAIVTLRVSIGLQGAALDEELAKLRADINYGTEQQGRYSELNGVRDVLAQRLRALEGLRGGLPARRMFVAIDEASNGDTWLRRWAYRRRGEIVEPDGQAVHAGYLIIVTPTAGSGSSNKTWRLDTHMEITGSALSHTAIADFVERLARRSDIADARILRTGSRKEAGREIIDFDLAVTVYGGRDA